MARSNLSDIELKKFADGLNGLGLPTHQARFYGKEERYCDVADWRDSQHKAITVSVYVAPYLGRTMSFWAGFGCKSNDPIIRLMKAYQAAHKGLHIPAIDSSHWSANLKLHAVQRKQLERTGGIATED
jgi:hypothetical protein